MKNTFSLCGCHQQTCHAQCVSLTRLCSATQLLGSSGNVETLFHYLYLICLGLSIDHRYGSSAWHLSPFLVAFFPSVCGRERRGYGVSEGFLIFCIYFTVCTRSCLSQPSIFPAVLSLFITQAARSAQVDLE